MEQSGAVALDEVALRDAAGAIERALAVMPAGHALTPGLAKMSAALCLYLGPPAAHLHPLPSPDRLRSSRALPGEGPILNLVR